MPKNYSININDFSGIFRAMAEKANVNGGDTLDAGEISIFNDIMNTYNIKNNTFLFEQDVYNSSGNSVCVSEKTEETAVSTRVQKILIPETLKQDQINIDAINKAKAYGKKIESGINKTIIINKKVNGKRVKFSYNRNDIENYIIYHSVDSKGNEIRHFSDIPNIRKKNFALRTHEENKKLAEFNNMVNSAINAGVEYGIDPKLIFAIIQREVGFNGLRDSAVGPNGKGYMQLTSAPIKDMLGGYTKNKKIHYDENLKTEKYGPEIIDLLKSRGFNVFCSADKRGDLAENIMQYLKSNKDVDFNIRLGTLVLRQIYYECDGNIQLTAQNYNGNSKNGIKHAYGKAVKNYYNQIVQNKA